MDERRIMYDIEEPDELLIDLGPILIKTRKDKPQYCSHICDWYKADWTSGGFCKLFNQGIYEDKEGYLLRCNKCTKTRLHSITNIE